MTHAELINCLLTGHGTVLAAVLGGFVYSFSDVFAGPLKETPAILEAMCDRMAVDLARKLEPIFENLNSVSSSLLDCTGKSFTESPVNPAGSEALKEVVRDFVGIHSDSMSDYRCLVSERKAWCFWTNALNWLVITLFVWQIVVVGLLLCDKLTDLTLVNVVVVAICVPTALCIGCSAVCILFCILHQSRINGLRLKHGKF